MIALKKKIKCDRQNVYKQNVIIFANKLTIMLRTFINKG